MPMITGIAYSCDMLVTPMWCSQPDLNWHGYAPSDFKSDASTYFAMRAEIRTPVGRQGIHLINVAL